MDTQFILMVTQVIMQQSALWPVPENNKPEHIDLPVGDIEASHTVGNIAEKVEEPSALLQNEFSV